MLKGISGFKKLPDKSCVDKSSTPRCAKYKESETSSESHVGKSEQSYNNANQCNHHELQAH